MDVLMLDFDGVLHPAEVYIHTDAPRVQLHVTGRSLFDGVPALERLLAPYPRVQIVLSTSWVPTFGYAATRDMLPSSLQGRVCGSTYDPQSESAWRFNRLSRYDQIAEYVARYRPARWLAVDDDAIGWPALDMDRLVLTPPDQGLGSERARVTLERALERTFGGARARAR